MSTAIAEPEIEEVAEAESAAMATTSTTGGLAIYGQIKTEVTNGLIDREDEVDLLMVGILSRQNVLFVSEPGTAKTLMIESFSRAIGAKDFVQLMHKYLPPEELLGPVKMTELKQDRYERMVKDMLPEAEVAFLDEIWKCSPALLNTLLRLLNERSFRNGTAGMMQCPLHSCFAASNEFPIGLGYETVGALYDRFLIRKVIKPVAKASRRKLIWGNLPKATQVASMADIAQMQADTDRVKWSAAAKTAVIKVIGQCEKDEVHIGDRRMRAIDGVCRAQAYLNGNGSVQVTDLDVLEHVLWTKPDDHGKVAHAVEKVSNPNKAKIREVMNSADGLLKGLDMKKLDSPETFEAVTKLKAFAGELSALEGPDAEAALNDLNAKRKNLRDAMVGEDIG